MADKRYPLVVILGPTAVGKTELSIQLAERIGGEIISADSRLFYKGMDIGTAKPSTTDQKRIRHHLIDVTTPDNPWSLANFQGAVLQAVQSILDRNKLPLLVGGTGQYVRALLDGWQIPQVTPFPALRVALENWAKKIGTIELHQRLQVIDPQAATQIDPRNLRRTVRALEVIFTSGYPFSLQRRRTISPYHPLRLGLMRPRSDLYARIDARIETMFTQGLIEEVQSLLDQGYAPDLPVFSAIGYRQVVEYIQGRISLEETKTQMKRQTRIFVRRQANWFKETDPDIHWFNVDSDTISCMERAIRQWINESGLTFHQEGFL
jgi:tRNA dimethylallyltransferase